MKIKPSIPKGTRDFSPAEVYKRNYIFNTIRNVFEQYGFVPIETPAMENLGTLTGKYGEEGDQLLFKILNSGDFLKGATEEELKERDLNKLLFKLSEKGLRYDLTIPFARYVVMNQHDITFPFKRYQIQPVWRADRPQKGRYREFYQCDIDVIGSDSLLSEVEFVQIYDTVFRKLGLEKFVIKLNNRKILEGITEVLDIADKFVDVTVAIDKLDKVGRGGVADELASKGIEEQKISKLLEMVLYQGINKGKLDFLRSELTGSENGLQGVRQMEYIFDYLDAAGYSSENIELDISLARGLSYYTGAIFEVKMTDERISIGSIGGGGRYDDLTGVFGLPDVSGVGISFGADRIYDVMEELKLFPESTVEGTQVLFTSLDEESEKQAFKYLQVARKAGIRAEIYPGNDKMKKQMRYANNKNIPYVAIIGPEEMKQDKITLKNMTSGEQQLLTIKEAIAVLKP